MTQGLTGLAQVNGRNNISWEEKLAWDQKYVKHVTFLGDLWIILRTGKVDQTTYDRKQRIARCLCEKNS